MIALEVITVITAVLAIIVVARVTVITAAADRDTVAGEDHDSSE